MPEPFAGIDFSDFWNEAEYYAEEYTDDPLTPEKIALVERELGYKLPAAYIALMRNRNGGAPVRTKHRTAQATSWAEDHIAITGIFAIGNTTRYSLCGEAGNHHWLGEWEYPEIGVYFADCPSAGHDMLCLDYRECGPAGEPSVVHVDQEYDYAITPVAPNFEAFIRGLEDEEDEE